MKTKILSIILIPSLILGITIIFNTEKVLAALQTITHTSQEDFSGGDENSTLDINQSSGDIRLKYNLTGSNTDTTKLQFDNGEISSIPNSTTSISETGNGEVIINKGYSYTHDTYPFLISRYTRYVAFNESNSLLYVISEYYEGGVSVINTNSTISPFDDTLIATYSTTSTPAIESNDGVFIDVYDNLVYIGTYGGGLSVINTQGTLSPSDDTLVITYKTTSSPAIGYNRIFHAFIDENNLLYVSTWGGGLSVINTQGTVTAADDTLLFTYNESSSPSIEDDYVYYTYLDTTNDLLYISTWEGLSVINTQGTVSPADDSLVTTYTSISSPAVANEHVYRIHLDTVNNLIYVGTYGGVSVINTQGTVSAADDTLVTTYNTSSSPSIGEDKAYHPILDSDTNLLYVATFGGGVSVINTQGTISPADDTLETTYTATTSPSIQENSNKFLFFNSDKSMLYITTYNGLSVILFDEYNTQGIYTREMQSEDDTWETKSSMSTARIAAASGVINGKIYIAGGTQDWSDVATAEEYNPQTDTWADKASMSASRVTPGYGVIGDKLYVVGGRDDAWDAVDTNEEYNPATNTWQTKTAMPTARVGPASAVFNDKLYVIGGQDTSAGNSLDTVEVYDPGTDSWDTKTSIPIALSQGHTAETINGKIYVAGGGVYEGTPPFLDTLYVYNPATDTWTEKASMPKSRAGLSSVVINNMMYAIGGSDESDWNPVDTIYIYDPTHDFWQRTINLPLALHRSMTEVVDGSLYIIGGKNVGWASADSTYKLDGIYLDDLYQKEAYSLLTWTATIPSGTSIEMLYSLNSGETYSSIGTLPGTYYIPPNEIDSFIYKALLSTTNTSQSPSLDSVQVSYAQLNEGLYESTSGTYYSSILDAGQIVDWQELTSQQSTPSGTSLTFYTRSGETSLPGNEWSDWELVNSPISSPYSQYLQYRVDFASTDVNETPEVQSVTIQYDDEPEGLADTGSDIVLLVVIGNIFLTTLIIPIIKENRIF